MTNAYELILAGKNIVLNANGFLDYVQINAEPSGETMSLKKGFIKLSKPANANFLLATVHNGQPMLLRESTGLNQKETDEALQEFTKTSGTDLLCFHLNKQFKFQDYSYYRAGQRLKSTATGKPRTEIPYEKLGATPELVLTAFCDSWLVLQQLEWEIFQTQPSAQRAGKV